MQVSGTIAIIPMKPLVRGKTRLSEELSQDQRTAIGRNLLRRVLRAINGSGIGAGGAGLQDIWVVGGDLEVQNVTESEGASWYAEWGQNINETVQLAFQKAYSLGHAALYLPGDLPFIKPKDVYGLIGASGRLKNVTLASARKGGGTNAILALPGLSNPFVPMLGTNSFNQHMLQATSLGISVSIYYSPGIGFDLDTLDDLKAYEYMEPGLLNKLTES